MSPSALGAATAASRSIRSRMGAARAEPLFRGGAARLERVGADSFAELHAALARHGIDARFEANGVLWIASERYQVEEIDDEVELIRRFGGDGAARRGQG